ncbi:hypothetical protein SASPL_156212 [Salvia splendens]|uniref:COMPASS component SWD3 n=1 Tax=Salvia splendens TaxID=180675 RepID=A0A8X8VX46_SALSN|nr:hypothetical protein SASPL_156212 [Salvia splendens]
MKVSSGNIGGLSDGISVGEQGSCSLGGSMALQLASGDDKVVGSNGLISKVEFVRIITEALYSLGYSKIGKHLEEESGIPLHSNLVATFIQQILDGQWDESSTTQLGKCHCSWTIGVDWTRFLVKLCRYLASSSRDSHVIIWVVNVDGHVIMRHRLTGHGQPVSCVSWSPEDDQILTCGEDKTVRRWDIDSGECLCVYGKQNLGLVSCEWAADGKHIFTGVTDKSIRMWDLEGKEVDFCQGKTAYHMENLGITTDGKALIIHCKDDGVFLFGWETGSERSMEENQKITSFALSEDGKLLLLSLWDGDLHLWNIDGWLQNIGEYIGNKRSSLVVRSCLGGLKQAFVASGSENSQVYIWHRHYVRPIFSFEWSHWSCELC